MKYILLTLSLLLASPLESLAAPAHGVVLMYHRFDEGRYPSTSIRREQFEAQLDYLQQNGYTLWPLRKLLDALQNDRPVPDRTVALTVDDAYHSVYHTAYPLLRQRNIPLTVFVSTGAVDKGLPGFMTWQQMREMQQHGIDFANHGALHLHMTHRQEGEDEQQWLQRVRRDIELAQQRLDSELGEQGARLFAYPFGEYNTAVATLLQQLGYTAFGQQSGAIGGDSDPRALPRFPINEHFAALDTFAIKVSSLPLPLEGQVPWEPELAASNPPVLELKLRKDGNLSAGQLSCFLGNGSALKRTVKSGKVITVVAERPLETGRNRYNCTAPAGNGRYYWFSQPWFNGPDPADPAY